MRFIKKEGIAPIAISAVLSVFGVFAIAQAATTIGANVATDGTVNASSTLQVTGVTTLFGATNASSTLDVDGAATFNGAASIAGAATFTGGTININKTATTSVAFSSAGVAFDTSTLVLDPNANRVGILTTTPNTALEVVGTASTTQLVIGGGTTIKKHLSTTVSVTAGALAGNGCNTYLQALTGAAAADTVALGGLQDLLSPVGASSTMTVYGYTTPNQVVVRICQATTTAGYVPAFTATVDVWQH